jgi:hypothetical protein
MNFKLKVCEKGITVMLVLRKGYALPILLFSEKDLEK